MNKLIKNWLGALKDDRTILTQAGSQSARAVDLIVDDKKYSQAAPSSKNV